MTSRHTLSLLSALFLLHACEKVDVSPDKGADASVQRIVPTSLGQGTQDSPYTVSQVLSGEAGAGMTSWVCGYNVGSTYRTMNNAIFEAQTTYNGNILISDDSLCTDKSRCIAVELTSTAVQQSLSLVGNPHRFRQCVVVKGLLGRYFSQPGIRDAQSGYYIEGFDIADIDTSPSDWDESSFTY